MLWIFPAGKIRRLRSGANPRSWVPEASALTTKPLEHRSRSVAGTYFFTAGRQLIFYAGIISLNPPVTRRTQMAVYPQFTSPYRNQKLPPKVVILFGNSPHSLALSLAF
jgi:hypothetical protein